MDESKFDTAKCLEQVRQSDESAAAALVEHLYPLVIKIVRSRLPRRLDEQDLAQEIFLKMFSKLDQYRSTAPFEHWVARLARNACLNQLRAEKSRPEWRWADLSEQEVAVLDALPGAQQSSLDPMAAHELVEKLLETLSPDDRLIIQWLELDDLSVEEIHQRSGWSHTRIRVRAFRARKKLRKRLEALQEKDDRL